VREEPTRVVRAIEVRPGDVILTEIGKATVAKVRTRRRLDIPPTPETRITIIDTRLASKGRLTHLYFGAEESVHRVIDI